MSRIVDAMFHPEVFGSVFTCREEWSSWVIVLLAIFGEPLQEEQLRLFRDLTGREAPPSMPVREAWLIVGRRGGKSRIAALLAVYLACFVEHDLPRGDEGVVMCISATQTQANKVLSYIRSFLDGCEVLRCMVVEDRKVEGIELIARNGRSIRINVFTNDYRKIRGHTVVAAIVDEVAFLHAEHTATPDTETYKALRPAMATVPNSLLVGISSPYAQRGLLYEQYREHYGKEDPRVLVVKAPSLTMNPTLDREEVAEAFRKDPEAARAEYGAEFRSDIESYISREVVEQLVVAGRHELAPEPGIVYGGFCDPSGGRGDSMTLAIAYQAGDSWRTKIVVVLLRETRPPFDPESVVREYCALLQRYRIRRVVGDHYGAEWVTKQFHKYGVVYEPSPMPKSDLYVELVPRLMTGTVELLDNETLIDQLCSLERRTSRRGRDSIDHPPRGHDDLANALAGAVVTYDHRAPGDTGVTGGVSSLEGHVAIERAIQAEADAELLQAAGWVQDAEGLWYEPAYFSGAGEFSLEEIDRRTEAMRRGRQMLAAAGWVLTAQGWLPPGEDRP